MNWRHKQYLKKYAEMRKNKEIMYRKIKPWKSTLTGSTQYEAVTLEGKIRKIMESKEGITEGAPIIYTERKDGVLPAYDIRTDRFEIAIDAMDSITRGHKAKREERIGKRMEELKTQNNQNETGGQPTESK